MDNRKHYPGGTGARVEIGAITDEPQTKRRGHEFQEIVRDVMVESRALLEQRLTEHGFDATVRITDANCEAGFPAQFVEWRP